MGRSVENYGALQLEEYQIEDVPRKIACVNTHHWGKMPHCELLFSE